MEAEESTRGNEHGGIDSGPGIWAYGTGCHARMRGWVGGTDSNSQSALTDFTLPTSMHALATF